MKHGSAGTLAGWKRRLENAGRSKRGWLASIVACGFVLSGIWVFGVRAYNNKSISRTSAAVITPFPRAASQPPPRLQSGPAQKIEAEVITIQPTGFEPAKITRPKGLFLLAIENRSGLRTIEVSLDNDGGSRFYAARLRMDKHDLAQGLDLPPGSYVLREGGHPAWSCTITILNK